MQTGADVVVTMDESTSIKEVCLSKLAQESDHPREQTLINIGRAFTVWRQLYAEAGARSDAHFAMMLLYFYKHAKENPLSVKLLSQSSAYERFCSPQSSQVQSAGLVQIQNKSCSLYRGLSNPEQSIEVTVELDQKEDDLVSEPEETAQCNDEDDISDEEDGRKSDLRSDDDWLPLTEDEAVEEEAVGPYMKQLCTDCGAFHYNKTNHICDLKSHIQRNHPLEDKDAERSVGVTDTSENVQKPDTEPVQQKVNRNLGRYASGRPLGRPKKISNVSMSVLEIEDPRTQHGISGADRNAYWVQNGNELCPPNRGVSNTSQHPGGIELTFEVDQTEDYASEPEALVQSDEDDFSEEEERGKKGHASSDDEWLPHTLTEEGTEELKRNSSSEEDSDDEEELDDEQKPSPSQKKRQLCTDCGSFYQSQNHISLSQEGENRAQDDEKSLQIGKTTRCQLALSNEFDTPVIVIINVIVNIIIANNIIANNIIIVNNNIIVNNKIIIVNNNIINSDRVCGSEERERAWSRRERERGGEKSGTQTLLSHFSLQLCAAGAQHTPEPCGRHRSTDTRPERRCKLSLPRSTSTEDSSTPR
ncbi:hypothetical protein WMY93_001373 [Mugilogobius chulae]|uniref:Uncharacterized protein n=1 Tax=Mugilogobius chulae TaxID=88201 RepID=A0AAW0Q535_9GOBI